MDLEGDLDLSRAEDQRNMASIPTKTEMVEMFAKLENSIKTEFQTLGQIWGTY